MNVRQYLFGCEYQYCCCNNNCPGASWYVHDAWVNARITVHFCTFCRDDEYDPRDYKRWK